MVALPPLTPSFGLTNWVRLAREYHVRIGGNEYSVGPRAIGWTLDVISVTCAGQVVATHARFWGAGAPARASHSTHGAKASHFSEGLLRSQGYCEVRVEKELPCVGGQ